MENVKFTDLLAIKLQVILKKKKTPLLRSALFRPRFNEKGKLLSTAEFYIICDESNCNQFCAELWLFQLVSLLDHLRGFVPHYRLRGRFNN
jgi:hypothetical protein